MRVRKINGTYVEEGSSIEPLYLSDEEYGRAVRALILVTADVILVDPAKRVFHLAKRIVEPWPDWWYIGGRRRPGETAQESAAKNFERETTLHVDPERFSLLSAHENIWASRKENPRGAGKHDVSYVFTLELTPTELEYVSKNLDINEYADGLHAFDRERMEREDVHPSILDMHAKFFTRG